ncbi:DUF5344 family protein [Bacillus sp. FSL W7-1360]
MEIRINEAIVVQTLKGVSSAASSATSPGKVAASACNLDMLNSLIAAEEACNKHMTTYVQSLNKIARKSDRLVRTYRLQDQAIANRIK